MVATMEAAMFIMFNMHACVCTHACACVHVHACAHVHGGCPRPNPPIPTHPPPRGGTPQISKNAIRLEQIEIFQFRLKIWNLWRIRHSWVDVFWGGGWMGGLVGRKM